MRVPQSTSSLHLHAGLTPRLLLYFPLRLMGAALLGDLRVKARAQLQDTGALRTLIIDLGLAEQRLSAVAHGNGILARRAQRRSRRSRAAIHRELVAVASAWYARRHLDSVFTKRLRISASVSTTQRRIRAC